MSFLHLAKRRYSVRKFHPKKVEEEKLQKILEAARVAPTAVNYQPFKLIVCQQEEGLNKVKKAARIYDAPLAIIVCGDRDRVWRRNLDGKTTLDIDASIVTDHMMLQAADLDLGSVWICYFKPDVIKAEFQLPDNLEPINILAIGYASGVPQSPDRHDTQRRPLSDLVTYE
ncbi:MAG TPA: nitroreductase family protein [Armatimonadota bacterium]|nr:nitroreductase family protein [Armatimonadota bacterium]